MDWKPPRFGEKRENEVSCFTVSIANLPMNDKTVEFMKWVQTFDGFVGIYPHYPYGTLILFKTENDAKGGRNLLRAKGYGTGKNIGEVFVEKQYVERKKEQ